MSSNVLFEKWWQHTRSRYPADPWVIHNRGRRVGSITWAWTNAHQRVGLEGKLFHDFRRTAVRNMVRAGISERVAMMISGHKTRAVFDRYDIVSEGDLKEATHRMADRVSTMMSTTLTAATDNEDQYL